MDSICVKTIPGGCDSKAYKTYVLASQHVDVKQLAVERSYLLDYRIRDEVEAKILFDIQNCKNMKTVKP